VVERLLLYRIDTEARRAAVGGQHHPIADPLAHEASAALLAVQAAVARAQVALHAAVVEHVPVARRIESRADAKIEIVHRGDGGSSGSLYLITV
jgi:hypothetical protein